MDFIADFRCGTGGTVYGGEGQVCDHFEIVLYPSQGIPVGDEGDEGAEAKEYSQQNRETRLLIV